MSDYLDYLIEDIEKLELEAQQFFAAKGYLSNGLALNKQKFVAGGMIRFEDLFQISIEALPEPHKLSEAELDILSYKLEKLLQAYHFYFDFPLLLPKIERYRIIRQHWRKEVKLALAGEMHLDFCHSSPHQCPYERYCNICKDLED